MKLGFCWYWCSMTPLMDSRREFNRLWLSSFTRRKDGEEIDAKSCKILFDETEERCWTCGAMLAIIARSAG